MTIREQILASIVTRLSAAPSLSGRVYRSRVEAFSRAESTAVLVEPISDQAEQTTIPRLDWALTVRVAVVARGAIPDQVADPFAEEVHARMTADLSLGGLAMDVQPVGVSFEMIGADQPAGVISMDFRVLYKTSLTNISTV